MHQTNHILPSFDGTPLWVEISTHHPHPVVDVVLVHGLTGDTSAYHWVIESLLHDSPIPVRCITYDLRGHGYSGRPFPPESQNLVEVIAKDLMVVCQQEVKRPFLLAGQSLFGLVLQKYLTLPQHPEPSQICLITPVLNTPGLSLSPGWWFRRLKAAAQTWPPHTTKRTPEDHLKHVGSFDFSPGRIYSDIKFMGFESYLLFWMALFGSPRPKYQLLNLSKVHYIYGFFDLVAPAFGQKLHLRHLPNVQVHPIPANHNAIVNQPNQIVPILIQACSQVQSSSKF